MKISIIGAGNMGGAIACGLIKAGIVEPANLFVADVNERALQPLREQGATVFTRAAEAVSGTEMAIVAVKPWLVKEVLHKIHPTLPPEAMLVSIAAGVTLTQIQEEMQGRTVFRVIPNTAIAAGQSMSFITADNANDEQKQTVLDVFSAMGSAMYISESQMPAATALSSCGIAYVMRYISANMRAGVELGFTPDDAKAVMLQTLQGAVSLLQQSGLHPEAEIDRVTTPKGLTIKGLNELEHGGFSSAIVKAVKAGT